jgi:TolB-like protein/Flp pilus assembly protein TadD
MAEESPSDFDLEIAHVLFMDIVGYSKLSINQQSKLLSQLTQIVRDTELFRTAEGTGKLVRLPTGDGMALVFFTSPDAPLRCAQEISRVLRNHPELPLRVGIHSGPVEQVADVNDRKNLAGAGINVAQRVMDCGDAGHILLSKRAADDLSQHDRWQPYLHDLGDFEVKHGSKIGVVNFFTDDAGNSRLPQKLMAARKGEHGARRRRMMRSALVPSIIVIAVALALWVMAQRRAPQQIRVPPGVIPEKTIAVLPFENLSPQKDDAFFADGIQDDVLTSLGKIKELTVIARASVMVYRGAAVAGKLREIGQTLRVSHVLEGSVRRSANRVVVNVQLIDTRDDRQLWSERYERSLTDTLSLQGELAIEIARQLQANLSVAEKSNVVTKPTENPDAYVLYLRARELETGYQTSDEDREAAAKLYQQAIDLDPKFALAHARLSIELSNVYNAADADPAGKAKVLPEAEEALRLQPALGEGRLALGYYFLWGGNDLDRALLELSRAAELMPSSAEVWRTRAFIYKRQDKLRERIAALQQAATLDPRDTNSLNFLRVTFRSVRNWPEALRTGDRMKALFPSVTDWSRDWEEFRMTGVIDPLKKIIAETPGGTPLERFGRHYEVAMLERDYSAADRYLKEIPAAEFGDWTHPKRMQEALLAVASGADPEVVERALVAARQESEKLLAASPNDYKLYGNLGLIDAFRGRKEEAIREGRRWAELENYSILEKNDAAAALALIYARTGEPEEAIKLIERLLTGPANLSQLWVFSMTQSDLKWRWVWDSLRSNPRFQKILAGPEPKTVY